MKYLIAVVLVMSSAVYAPAQCAMCKATLENNISNGHIGIAAGINFGILYLFVAPYLFISILAYFWYRTSRKNAEKSIDSNWAG
jgi:heme/copper-type cytochrome/quinol oxidase subunit 3